MRIRQAFAIGLLATVPALTGCLTHTHSVLKTRPPEIVLNATLDQLLNQVNTRYDSTQSITLFVEMSASTGGSRQGKVTESVSFSGFIFVSKPENINVLLKVPLLGSDALDMVSDGKNFKMIIPHQDCAIIGSDAAPPAPPPGAEEESLSTRLHRLRPDVILDSLLIRGLQPGQIVSMTQDDRPPIPAPKTKTQIIEGKGFGKTLIQDPDYDLEFLSEPTGQVAHTLRVVHIDRSNLLPWRQDIYNSDGRIETQAFYDNYQHFGDIVFPTKITIQRPLDELGLTITVERNTKFNVKLPPDQFELAIPPHYIVQNMDNPASAASNPCVAHPAASAAPAATPSAK